MYTKVPPDGHVYSEQRVLMVLLYLPCVAHRLRQCVHKVTTKHTLLLQENPKSAWYVLVLYLLKREQCCELGFVPSVFPRQCII